MIILKDGTYYEPSDEQIKQINRRNEVLYGALDENAIRQIHSLGLNEKETEVLAVIQDYYAVHRGEILTTAIEQATGFSGSTCHRILKKLVKKSLIIQKQINIGKSRPAHGFVPNN